MKKKLTKSSIDLKAGRRERDFAVSRFWRERESVFVWGGNLTGNENVKRKRYEREVDKYGIHFQKFPWSFESMTVMSSGLLYKALTRGELAVRDYYGKVSK